MRDGNLGRVRNSVDLAAVMGTGPEAHYAQVNGSAQPAVGLPRLSTLVYLEKAGTVLLLALAFLWLAGRAFKVGPGRAIADAARVVR
jgi:hypothetical protein